MALKARDIKGLDQAQRQRLDEQLEEREAALRRLGRYGKLKGGGWAIRPNEAPLEAREQLAVEREITQLVRERTLLAAASGDEVTALRERVGELEGRLASREIELERARQRIEELEAMMGGA